MATATPIEQSMGGNERLSLLRIRTPVLMMNEKEEYISPIVMYAKKGVSSLRETLREKFALLSFCNLVSVISLGTAFWNDRVPFVGYVFLASTGLLGSSIYWTLYPPVESVGHIMRKVYQKVEKEDTYDCESQEDDGPYSI